MDQMNRDEDMSIHAPSFMDPMIQEENMSNHASSFMDQMNQEKDKFIHAPSFFWPREEQVKREGIFYLFIQMTGLLISYFSPRFLGAAYETNAT